MADDAGDVSAATEEVDREDAESTHDADRPPTEAEAKKADANELDPKAAEAYEEAIERGANVEGEGKID